MATFIKMEDTYLFRHLYVRMIHLITKQTERSVPFHLATSTPVPLQTVYMNR